MKIITQTPIDHLVSDPFRGHRSPLSGEISHGAFQSLAQGAKWREKLQRLDEELLKYPQIDLPITHRYSRGVYSRTMYMPRGTILTGRIHKYSQINILLRGEVSVLTEEGMVRVKAPFVVESPAGTKRAMYAHEDSEWMTIMGTDITDPDEALDELTAWTYDEYDKFCIKQISQEN